MIPITKQDESIALHGCMNCYPRKDDPTRGCHGPIVTDGYISHRGFHDGEYKKLHYFSIGPAQGYYGLYEHPVRKTTEAHFFLAGSNEGSAIRGTGDWSYNYQFKLVQEQARRGREFIVPYGNVTSQIRKHVGFEIWYQKYVRAFAREFARWAFKKKYRLLAGGHSAGASVGKNMFADILYMHKDENRVPLDEVNELLYAIVAAGPAVGNAAYRASINSRANGTLVNLFYGSDPVWFAPPRTMGYDQEGDIRHYCEGIDSVLYPVLTAPHWITFGTLPSMLIAAYDHDPRRLLAAIEGRPIPIAKMLTDKL
jgi:hypothetical protein